MIKSIRLKNIVSHKDTVLHLDPGVNMLIGPSENGKSVIINSILKLIYNRPLGDKWRSWWGGKSEITISLENHTITLFQDKGPAKYRIQEPDESIKEIMAHGTSEIENIFRFNRRVNIRKQLEKQSPIFLVSESPGDVAKHFNQIANIDDINITLDKGKKEVKHISNEIDSLKNLIDEKQTELKTYDGIEDLLLIVKSALSFKTDKEKIEAQIQKLSGLQISLWQTVDKLKGKQKELRIKQYVEEAINLSQQKDKIKTKIEHIQDMVDGINTLLKQKEHHLKLLRIKPDLKLADGYFDNLNDIKSKIKSIQRKKERIQGILNSKKTCQILLTKTKKAFNDLMPDTCPLCNSITKRK